MLKLLCISIHIPNFSLDFQNFYFSMVSMVRMAELHHYAKFCWNSFNRGRDIAIFRYFKMAAAAILDFKNFKLFNGRNNQETGTASLCQISSKSFKPWPRYASFNIMLLWLENAYSRLFFGGTFLPNYVTHNPYPKKDHPWAKPRHLSHKPRVFSYRLLNGHYKSPLHIFPLV